MPIQTVQRQASPAGYDLVQPVIYDALGREYRKYLPYKAASTDGGFKIGSPHANVKTFYNPSSPGAIGIAATAYPFSETVLEKSLLNRILEQGAPGESWQPTLNTAPNGGHTIKTLLAPNNYGEVSLWSISGTTCSATNYNWGTLQKITTTDENGNESIDYKDKLGKVVLKQAEKNGGVFINTYYVYDEFENLRYVIPPAVNVTSFTEADALFAQYIYAYHYDDQNRLIEKKVPGKGWEYMVYNQLDQVVLTQDAVQKQANKWLYTRYDALNRIVMKGEYGSGSNRATLQAAVLAYSGGAYETFTGSGTDGYSLNTFPQTDYNILTMNYYGTYNIPGKTSTYDATASGITSAIKGLFTGSKVNILGSSIYLLTVNYYDEFARLRETIAQNHVNGIDRIINTYSFNNELTNTTRTHNSSTATVMIANRYTYDHMGRKKQSFQQMNSDAEVKLAESNYNEVDQLMTKTLHNDLQSTSFSYNPRGWLKGSSSSQFTMELKYEDGTTPPYNGNIANQLWGNGSLGNTFTYAYDNNGSLNFDISGNLLLINCRNKPDQKVTEEKEHRDSISTKDSIPKHTNMDNGVDKKTISPYKEVNNLVQSIKKDFDISKVKKLDSVCLASDGDLSESFWEITTILLDEHLNGFTNYYLSYPKSCLKERLVEGIGMNISMYEKAERPAKLKEEKERILKKASDEKLSEGQVEFIQDLFKKVNPELFD